MFTFSAIHAWQNDLAVQQVLVFPNQEVQTLFEERYASEVAKHGVEDASDSNLGAIYKLRAVKTSTDTYVPTIRCGFTGKHLWEDITLYDTPESAIQTCLAKLSLSIFTALKHARQA